MKEIKVGFIGFGNMAQAMAEGMIRGGALEPDRIYACAGNQDKLRDNAGRYGIHGCESKGNGGKVGCGHCGGETVSGGGGIVPCTGHS